MNEIWKKYNESYEVSDHGNVRSVDRLVVKKDRKSYRIKGKDIKVVSANTGYSQVSLGRKIPAILIHRLVAELFIPNPENKKTVNHKDGDKTNNNVSNLEWATYSENNIHARAIGLNTQCGSTNPPKGLSHWNSILDETQVLTIRKCSSDGMSNTNLSYYFKVSITTIFKVVHRQTWKHLAV